MRTGPQVESAHCVTLAFAYSEATAFSLRGMGFLLGGKEDVAYGDKTHNSVTMQNALERRMANGPTVQSVNYKTMSLLGRRYQHPCQGKAWAGVLTLFLSNSENMVTSDQSCFIIDG